MYHELENKNISKELKSLSRDYWTLESGKFKYSIEKLMGNDKEFNQRMIEHLEDIGYYEVEGRCNCCLKDTSWPATTREDYHDIIEKLADEEGHIFCPGCHLFTIKLNMWLKNPKGL
jgi:hypothetical protein